MKSLKIAIALALSLSSAGTFAAGAGAGAGVGRPPAVVGTCRMTTVKWVGTRLVDGPSETPVAGSGSSVSLADGVEGVSYDQVAAVDRSHVGDPAMTCLVRLPDHCPPGDRRGKLYTTTNLRTEESWTLYDAEHGCGGA